MKRLFCLLSLLGALSARAAPAPAKPNIIFILADDLGYTDLACYGSAYYETPNIDRLASQGVRRSRRRCRRRGRPRLPFSSRKGRAGQGRSPSDTTAEKYLF